MNELRMLLAEVLIRFSLSIVPKNEDGARLAKYIFFYTKEVEEQANG